MCERCREAADIAVRAIATGLKVAGSPGTQLVGDALAILAQDDMVEHGAERVNQIMLDAYPQSRNEAIAIASRLLVALTAIKNRLLEEALNAADQRFVAFWDPAMNGFHVSVVRTSEPWQEGPTPSDGPTPATFYALKAGETPKDGFLRIARQLSPDGELHG